MDKTTTSKPSKKKLERNKKIKESAEKIVIKEQTVHKRELDATTVQRLEKALEQSNTMQSFNLNKNTLKVKTQNLLSYSTNGGTFRVDQSLISFVQYIVESGRKEVAILDKNDIPILITDTEEFLENISSLYFEVINDYYIDYQKLRSSRKIEKVLEI
jgi:hypothetical protein